MRTVLVGVVTAATICVLPATAGATSDPTTTRVSGAVLNASDESGFTTFSVWQSVRSSDGTTTRLASVYLEHQSSSCAVDGSCTYTATTVYGEGALAFATVSIAPDLTGATLPPTELTVHRDSYTLDADGNVVDANDGDSVESVSATFTSTGALEAQPWSETYPGRTGSLSVSADRWRASDAVVRVGTETFATHGADGNRIYSGTRVALSRG